MAALHALGCVTLADRPFTVVVCRGGIKLSTLPKTIATKRVQRRILEQLEIEEDAYMDALAAVVRPSC